MFKSKEEVYLKPSSIKRKFSFLGIGNDFRLILLFSTLKSEMKRTVLFFLEIINVGAAHYRIIFTC